MSKRFTLAMAIGAISVLSTPVMADQLSEIKQKGTLVCGTLGTSEPFSFPDQQTREVTGYDVDFCKALAKSLGVKVELKLVAVAARIPELQQGRIDVIIANLGWTAERAQQIAFSHQYFASEQKVAVRKDSGFRTLNDLAGKRVSATKGSTSEQAVRKSIPAATTVTFQDPPSGFLALQQGKVEGFALSEMSLLKFAQQSESTVPVSILDNSLILEPWGVGMRKEETSLINQVNATLEALEKSGEALQIFNKWMGTSTQYKMRRGFRIEPIKG